MSDGAVLLLTLSDPTAPPGGREHVSRMNHAVLADLFGARLRLFRPDRNARPAIGDAVRGAIDGLDTATLAKLCTEIRAEDVRQVFIDGSNLGAAARAIKRTCPRVRVVTFFHNVEARFFLGALRTKPTAKAVGVLWAHYAAERLAVRWSDTIACLSARDGAGLRRLYGRGADAISPLALADTASVTPPAIDHPAPFVLFVGGGFYANIDGIAWFAKVVAPRLALDTVVVGQGMETLAARIGDVPRVEIVGAVDDLSGWYRAAQIVVAPIFSGSGMKTKVAEALMHGKSIIGTAEAFSGYDPAVVAGNWQCEDADGFVAAIEDARSLPSFAPEQRALYDRFHSPEAARDRMARIMLP